MKFPGPSRREFLRQAAVVVSAGVAGNLRADDLLSATLKLGSGVAGPIVPQDFIGLSYEVMQLEDPSFFSPKKAGLVQQFRNLSPHGVLRLGGNTSEFSWWKVTPDAAAPQRTGNGNDPGEPPPTTLHAITPEAIRELKGFLDSTGWTCIYGLNSDYGTVATDVAQATFVYQTLGSRLQNFQVCSDVHRINHDLRKDVTWNAEMYLQNCLQIARAVQQSCPGASFCMPDIAGEITWLTQIGERWSAVADKPRVTTLSHRYYVYGSPSDPMTTVEDLFKPKPMVLQIGGTAKAAAAAMHTRYRMTEGNTCYQGGKPGVSDVFAAALWSADYCFQLMQLGYCGLNLHGGSLRGGRLMADANAPHPRPFYTPIANEATLAGSGTDGKLGDRYVLEPVGAGLKFAGAFAGAQMVPVELETTLNVSAYAAKRKDGRTIVAILNKEASQALQVTAPFFQTLQTLTGPSLDARSATVSAVVRETASRRTAAGQTFILPPHFATLIVLE